VTLASIQNQTKLKYKYCHQCFVKGKEHNIASSKITPSHKYQYCHIFDLTSYEKAKLIDSTTRLKG
jgi:hypothetical protein